MKNGKNTPKLTQFQISRLLSEIDEVDEEIVILTNEEVSEIEAAYEENKTDPNYQERQYKEFHELVPDIFDLLVATSESTDSNLQNSTTRWDIVRKKKEAELGKFQQFTKKNKLSNTGSLQERLNDLLSHKPSLLAYRNGETNKDEDIDSLINAVEFLSDENSEKPQE